MSVSIGPASTAWTRIPAPASSARWDCVIDSAAALEMEYAGITGSAARAAIDDTLTTTPGAAVSCGSRAWVRLSGPIRLTPRWARTLASSSSVS